MIDLAVPRIGPRAERERRDAAAASTAATTAAAATPAGRAERLHDVVGRLRRRDRVERRLDRLEPGLVQGHGVHAREIVGADLPVVRSGLGLAVADQVRVVDDDLLDDFLILVAEHAEAAEAGLVGGIVCVLEPRPVGELVEVGARRARRVEVRAIQARATRRAERSATDETTAASSGARQGEAETNEHGILGESGRIGAFRPAYARARSAAASLSGRPTWPLRPGSRRSAPRLPRRAPRQATGSRQRHGRATQRIPCPNPNSRESPSESSRSTPGATRGGSSGSIARCASIRSCSSAARRICIGRIGRSARGRLPKSPTVWACGDLHLENFGSYLGDNRLVYFDLNDFDEAALAPAIADLTRLLASLRLAGGALRLDAPETAELSEGLLVAYCDSLASGKARWVERATARGMVRDLLVGARERSARRFARPANSHRGRPPSIAHRRSARRSAGAARARGRDSAPGRIRRVRGQDGGPGEVLPLDRRRGAHRRNGKPRGSPICRPRSRPRRRGRPRSAGHQAGPPLGDGPVRRRAAAGVEIRSSPRGRDPVAHAGDLACPARSGELRPKLVRAARASARGGQARAGALERQAVAPAKGGGDDGRDARMGAAPVRVAGGRRRGSTS